MIYSLYVISAPTRKTMHPKLICSECLCEIHRCHPLCLEDTIHRTKSENGKNVMKSSHRSFQSRNIQ